MFLLALVSKPGLDPIQLPIHNVLEILSPSEKWRPERGAEHSHPCSGEVKSK